MNTNCEVRIESRDKLAELFLFEILRATSLEAHEGGRTSLLIVNASGILPVTLGIRRIMARNPHAAVLVVGESPSSDAAIALLRLGVSGFVESERARTELAPAMQAVLDSKLSLPQDLLLVAQQRLRNHSHDNLTRRESEAFDLVKARFTNREIAEEMGITERGVRFLLNNAYSKLGIKGRRELFAAPRQRKAMPSTAARRLLAAAGFAA